LIKPPLTEDVCQDDVAIHGQTSIGLDSDAVEEVSCASGVESLGEKAFLPEFVLYNLFAMLDLAVRKERHCGKGRSLA
jgi:hypothetical protein